MKRAYVLVALVALGCQRATRESAEDGPEVSKAEVNAALARAMAGVSPDRARAGQSLSYVSTRQIGGGDSEFTLGGATMTTVEDPSEPHVLKLLIDTTARANDGHLKTTRIERAIANAGPRVGAKAVVTALVENGDAPTVTYHALRTGTEVTPAPEGLRTRPGCGGIPDCALSLNFVIFDVISRSSGATPTRVTVTLGFSPHPPYLPFGEGFDRFNGALVIDCRASRVRVDGHQVAVKDCRRLVDFER